MPSSSNRFDLIRLVFASCVFFYHAVVLSNVVPDSQIERHLATLAELSIQGFFIVSGALVMGSYERSNSLMDYAGKRMRRLYPAYAVVIFIPALIALLLSGTSGAFGEVAQYLGANLIFLNFLAPNLPGLFDGQHFTEVNGALWTLKIEVMFYLLLPIIAWVLARIGRFWWIGIGAMALMAFAWRDGVLALDHPHSAELSRQLPGQMMFFAAGIALWKMWALVRAKALLMLVIGAIALVLSLVVSGLEPLRVLGLAALIAGVAFVPGPSLNAAAWGDVSYGVYIVHFPVVQGLIALGVFASFGFWTGLILSTMLVFSLSYALWWWVEKPALRRDSHYRTVSDKRATP